MKAIIAALIALTLLGESTALADPRAKQTAPKATPHPKMWLVGFTFTMTDFARRQLANSDGFACGISQPSCGCVSGLLPLGAHMDYVWTRKGEYQNQREPYAHHVIFKASKSNSDITDITANDVRDILGADAISNVREIPYEEFQHQQQGKERVQISDALKLSAGNVPQTAVRLGMKEADLRKKMIQSGISDTKH